MKKLILASLLSLLTIAAHAECSITRVADDDTVAKFRKYGAWSTERGLTSARYNAVCEKLKRANARIQINAASSVLANMSIGWAIVSVMDMNTAIGTSSYYSANTQVNSYASQDKADELMVNAINASVQEWDKLDLALAELDEERNKLKATAKKR